MDSEDEGGCMWVVPEVWMQTSVLLTTKWKYPGGDVALKISLTGLKGGHSGGDIHLQRANANKLMFRFLKDK